MADYPFFNPDMRQAVFNIFNTVSGCLRTAGHLYVFRKNGQVTTNHPYREIFFYFNKIIWILKKKDWVITVPALPAQPENTLIERYHIDTVEKNVRMEQHMFPFHEMHARVGTNKDEKAGLKTMRKCLGA